MEARGPNQEIMRAGRFIFVRGFMATLPFRLLRHTGNPHGEDVSKAGVKHWFKLSRVQSPKSKASPVKMADVDDDFFLAVSFFRS